MNLAQYMAALSPEATLIGVIIGFIALVVGLKMRPKLTLALLVCSLLGWIYIENAEAIHHQFQSLSEADMVERH